MNNFLLDQYSQLKLWYLCSFFAGTVFFLYTTLSPSVTILILCTLPTLYIIQFFLPNKYILIKFVLLIIFSFCLAFVLIKLHYYKFRNINQNYHPYYKKNTILGKVSDILEYEQYYLLELKDWFFSGKPYNGSFKKINLKIDKAFKPKFDIKIDHTIEAEVKFFPSNNLNYSLKKNYIPLHHTDYVFAISQETPKLIYNKNSNKSLKLLIFNIRNNIDKILYKYLKKQNAEIASSLITGRAERINQDILNDLRNTGLAHMLAISGLHISIVGLGFFYIFRLILNLLGLWSKIDVKLISANLALLICFIFLLISGSKISAIRAFIMFAVIILANLVKKNSLSIRSIFFTATIMLIINPAYVVSISFQLSFIAVIFLAQNRDFLNSNLLKYKFKNKLFLKIIQYSLSNIFASFWGSVSSLVFSVYHFFQFPIYSLLSNFILMPVFLIGIMPLIIIGIICEIFSLGKYIFYALDLVLDFFLYIASSIAKLPFAVVHTGYIQEYIIGIFLFGVCWLIIWQGKVRYLAVIFFFFTLYGIFTPKKISYILFPDLTLIENKEIHFNVYYLKHPPRTKQIIFWKKMLAKEQSFLFPFIQNAKTISSTNNKINIVLEEKTEIEVKYDVLSDSFSIHMPENLQIKESIKFYKKGNNIHYK